MEEAEPLAGCQVSRSCHCHALYFSLHPFAASLNGAAEKESRQGVMVEVLQSTDEASSVCHNCYKYDLNIIIISNNARVHCDSQMLNFDEALKTSFRQHRMRWKHHHPLLTCSSYQYC